MELKTTLTKFFNKEQKEMIKIDVELVSLRSHIENSLMQSLQAALVMKLVQEIGPEVSKKIFLDKKFMDRVKENIEFLAAKKALQTRLDEV